MAVVFSPTVMNFVPGKASWRKSPSRGTPEAVCSAKNWSRERLEVTKNAPGPSTSTLSTSR